MIVFGWLANSSELCDFLEQEIEAGRNPKTPDEWTQFFMRFEKTGKCQKVLQQGTN